MTWIQCDSLVKSTNNLAAPPLSSDLLLIGFLFLLLIFVLQIVKGKVNLGFLHEDGSNNGSTDAEAGSVLQQQQDSTTNLPNQAVTSSDQNESVKSEKVEEESSTKKTSNEEQQQITTTKFDIEEEIDSLSVPTVFSSSPVVQPRSSSKRGSNIKMLKVVPHLAAKRFKSIGVPQGTTPGQATNNSEETSDGSVL